MRRWLKRMAVCGVIGATLGAAFAAERLTERKTVGPKKTRHPGAEYFSRNGETTGTSVSPQQELETLVSQANATPKPFVRNRDLSDEPIVGSAARSARNSEPKRLAEVNHAVPIANQAGPRTQPTKSDTAKLLTELRKNPRARAAEKETTSGVVDASFRQESGSKSKIQLTHSESRKAVAEPAVDELEDWSVEQPSKGNNKTPRITRATRTLGVERPTINRQSGNGQSGTPTVIVEWVKRGEISVGQECACDLLVTNTSKAAARQVIVEAFFPASVRLTAANPEPVEVEDHLEWLIDELPAGGERTIAIRMIPSQRGELATTANVRFTGTAASVFNVSEPLLKLAVSGPEEAAVGDPVLQTVTIANPGTGLASNVKLQLTIPKGLESTRGDHSLLDVGSLAPGESRTLRLSFTAISDGEQTLEINATADAELSQFAESTVTVTAPVLHASIEGPVQQYAGREAKYTIQVANDGRAITHNVRVTHQLPPGFKFVKADKNGSFDTASSTITWFLGAIETRQIAALKFTAVANELGDFDHHVQVTSDNIVAANAEFSTAIEGSAELALEILDLDDPGIVGHDTAYEIRVSNSGSKSARKVGLTFELPRGMKVGEVESPTKHFAKSGLILFNDLPELKPGKTAIYRVHVTANSDGNQRVRARLTSESVDEEVVAEETTKFETE